jgi:hypothetical protein
MLNDARQLGTEPVNEFGVRLSCCSWVATQRDEGILPVRLLPPTDSILRAGMVPRQSGREPMKWLLESSRFSCHQL